MRVWREKNKHNFSGFHKNEGNSRAIEQYLGETWEIQAIFIRHIFRAKVSRY